MKQINRAVKQVLYGVLSLGLLSSPIVHGATSKADIAVKQEIKQQSMNTSAILRLALPNTKAFRSVVGATANEAGDLTFWLSDHSTKTIKNSRLAKLDPTTLEQLSKGLSDLIKTIAENMSPTQVYVGNNFSDTFIDRVTNVAIERGLFNDGKGLGIFTNQYLERNDIQHIVADYIDMNIIPQYIDVDSLISGFFSMDELFDMASRNAEQQVETYGCGTSGSYNSKTGSTTVTNTCYGYVDDGETHYSTKTTTTTTNSDGSTDTTTTYTDADGYSYSSSEHKSSWWSSFWGDTDTKSSSSSSDGTDSNGEHYGQAAQITAASEAGHAHHIILPNTIDSSKQFSVIWALLQKDTSGLDKILTQYVSGDIDNQRLQDQLNLYFVDVTSKAHVQGLQFNIKGIVH